MNPKHAHNEGYLRMRNFVINETPVEKSPVLKGEHQRRKEALDKFEERQYEDYDELFD